MSLKNCGRMEAVSSAAFLIFFIITGSKFYIYKYIMSLPIYRVWRCILFVLNLSITDNLALSYLGITWLGYSFSTGMARNDYCIAL